MVLYPTTAADCRAPLILANPLFAHCPCSRKRVERPHRDFSMSITLQASRRQSMIARPSWLLFAVLVISPQHVATAHDLFTAYIQHSITLTVGARDTDLELDLTFFEEWSARERAADGCRCQWAHHAIRSGSLREKARAGSGPAGEVACRRPGTPACLHFMLRKWICSATTGPVRRITGFGFSSLPPLRRHYALTTRSWLRIASGQG